MTECAMPLGGFSHGSGFLGFLHNLAGNDQGPWYIPRQGKRAGGNAGTQKRRPLSSRNW